MDLEFRLVRPTDTAALSLIDALSHEIADRYAETFPMDGRSNFRPEEHNASMDIFVVAFPGEPTDDNNEPIVCGALRSFADGVVEVKRMYVAPAVRSHGIGRALLSFLESEASRLGYARVVLETGVLQPEALRLYESSGYTAIPPWPPYDARDYARCFEKHLT